MFSTSHYTLFPLYEFYSSGVFSHKVFNEVMLTHSKCHIIYFSSQRFFEDNIYDILISNQTVFRLCLWEYLKGLLTLELHISWCFSLFCPLDFKEFCLVYRYTLIFFPTGFSKASRWWPMNQQRRLREPIDQGGVLRLNKL